MTIAEILLNLASALGDFFASSSSLKRARQHDLATLLERISTLLIGTADKLERDKRPTEECAELFVYTQHLHMTLRKTMGFFSGRKIKSLVSQLEFATDAPFSTVMYLESKSTIVRPALGLEQPRTDAAAEIGKIREAGAKFHAAAELIRCGGDLPFSK